jgi:tetratricopeptide (TPR) repeat protein
MGSSARSDLLELAAFELRNCSQGIFPTGAHPLMELYRSQYGEFNARKAQALALTSNVPAIMKVRSHLMRGELSRAEVLLKSMRDDSQDQTALNEILLEEAKLASYEGDWAAAEEKASIALELQPTPTTHLALLQVRANALFELQEFTRSKRDLEVIDALREILPKSSAGFYARALEVKVFARLRGLSEASTLLKALWKQFIAKPGNADELLTLCRIEIDLRRFEGRSTLYFARATHALCRILGDRQYEALALIDLAYSVTASKRVAVQTRLNEATSQFNRVARVLSGIEDTIQSASLLDEEIEDRSFSFLSLPSHLYLKDHDLIVALEPWHLVTLTSSRVVLAVDELFKMADLDKAGFFGQVWGKQKYVPRLHDSLVWNLLSRIRKDCALEIAMRDGQIQMQSKGLRLT